jgi:outer membrane scaffolding protein for murein synthesis (MipA/OmpV family)
VTGRVAAGRCGGAASHAIGQGIAVVFIGLIIAGLPPPARAELSNESLIGPGARSRPAYDGSDSQRGELVPVVRWFGEPGFVRSTQGVFEGGLRSALAPGLYGGLQLAYEPGRKRSESSFLAAHPVEDLTRSLSFGAQLEWDHAFGRLPTTTLLRLRRNSQSQRGSQADLRLSAGLFQHGAFAAGLFAQGIWASAAATQTLYGLDSAQAATAGLPTYSAGSGWLSTSAGLLFGLELTRPWMLVGSLEARRLQGDAAHSPLVERRSSVYASAGAAWRF